MEKRSEFVMPVSNNRLRSKEIVGITHEDRAPPAFTHCSRLLVQKDILFKTLLSFYASRPRRPYFVWGAHICLDQIGKCHPSSPTPRGDPRGEG